MMRPNVHSTIVNGKTLHALTMTIHAQISKLKNPVHVYGINLTYVKNSLNVKIIQKINVPIRILMDV